MQTAIAYHAAARDLKALHLVPAYDSKQTVSPLHILQLSLDSFSGNGGHVLPLCEGSSTCEILSRAAAT